MAYARILHIVTKQSTVLFYAICASLLFLLATLDPQLYIPQGQLPLLDNPLSAKIRGVIETIKQQRSTSMQVLYDWLSVYLTCLHHNSYWLKVSQILALLCPLIFHFKKGLHNMDSYIYTSTLKS